MIALIKKISVFASLSLLVNSCNDKVTFFVSEQKELEGLTNELFKLLDKKETIEFSCTQFEDSIVYYTKLKDRISNVTISKKGTFIIATAPKNDSIFCLISSLYHFKINNISIFRRERGGIFYNNQYHFEYNFIYDYTIEQNWDEINYLGLRKDLQKINNSLVKFKFPLSKDNRIVVLNLQAA
ncbi:MAG: hypothetical protein RI955_257 [Bacteroidota bacterium]